MSLKKKFLVVLTALVSVVAIVAVSVMATVAYLTSSSAVSNVFTIGDVGIVFDEAAVDSDGVLISGAARRDTNTYLLVPGKKYIKDPTIHVNATSVDSYVFVISRNDLAQAEETDGDALTMLEQAQKYGWRVFTPTNHDNAPLSGKILVYCGGNGEGTPTPAGDSALATPVVAGKSYKMFDYFQLDEKADVTLYSASKITLSAYAIQADTFGDTGTEDALNKAWTAIVAHFPILTYGNPTGQKTQS